MVSGFSTEGPLGGPERPLLETTLSFGCLGLAVISFGYAGSPKGFRTPVSAVREILPSFNMLLKMPFVLRIYGLVDFMRELF